MAGIAAPLSDLHLGGAPAIFQGSVRAITPSYGSSKCLPTWFWRTRRVHRVEMERTSDGRGAAKPHGGNEAGRHGEEDQS